MNILILTGKFGMGHWSASQSLRQQLLPGVPRGGGGGAGLRGGGHAQRLGGHV